MARKAKTNHMHALVLSSSILMLFISLGLLAYNSTNAGQSFNAGKQLNANQCDTKGKPVINVTEKIENTVDSGEGGNYWAFDDINRQIQVWKNSENEYCALIQNQGKFDGQEDQKSPGNTGTLTGNEDGTFQGGYRAKIVGAMKEDPGWKTNGSVGTHDYNCDITGDCTNYINWVDQYFGPSYIFSYEWWGWTYNYKNKSWVNSSDGNSGDII